MQIHLSLTMRHHLSIFVETVACTFKQDTRIKLATYRKVVSFLFMGSSLLCGIKANGKVLKNKEKKDGQKNIKNAFPI